jgi:hypothetical protein
MSVYETECAQVDALIEIKQNEIKELEDLKASWTEESWDEPTIQDDPEVRYTALHDDLNEEAQEDKSFDEAAEAEKANDVPEEEAPVVNTPEVTEDKSAEKSTVEKVKDKKAATKDK